MAQPTRAERRLPPEKSSEVHPSRLELGLFLRSELPPDGHRAVVAHLLKRCPLCLEVIQGLWALGSRKTKALDALLLPDPVHRRSKPASARRGRAAVAVIESAAQEILLETVEMLEQVRHRLQSLVTVLPAQEEDWDPAEDNVIAELQAVIPGVLKECIRPAIGDLLSAAYFPDEPPEEGEQGEKK